MMNTKPLFIYGSKKYKIIVERQVFDTYKPITNKNHLANEYYYRDIGDDIPLNTFNKYKLIYPIYSMRIEFYDNNYNLLRSSAIIDIKYNGAFFSIMNRIRDTKFVQYIYSQAGSKKSNKFLTSGPYIFKKQRILNRLRYENGSNGLFYILADGIKDFLRFCPKHELRKIMSVIRHDYYKIMGKRN